MYIYTLLNFSFRCMVTWVSPLSPEMWAHCSTGKATWPASLPSPQWHASTSQLHVPVWTANVSSPQLQMLSLKREIGSVQREQKCSCLLSTTFICFQSPRRSRVRPNPNVLGSYSTLLLYLQFKRLQKPVFVQSSWFWLHFIFYFAKWLWPFFGLLLYLKVFPMVKEFCISHFILLSGFGHF